MQSQQDLVALLQPQRLVFGVVTLLGYGVCKSGGVGSFLSVQLPKGIQVTGDF